MVAASAVRMTLRQSAMHTKHGRINRSTGAAGVVGCEVNVDLGRARGPTRIPIVVVGCVLLLVGCDRSPRGPRIVSKSEWPFPMSQLLERYPKICESIETYTHDAFVDDKLAWRIMGQQEDVERLISDLNLQQISIDHPKFKELQCSIPEMWNLPDSAETKVHVTEGYGVEHQEGTDLLLLVHDSQHNVTIVLYEWIF